MPSCPLTGSASPGANADVNSRAPIHNFTVTSQRLYSTEALPRSGAPYRTGPVSADSCLPPSGFLASASKGRVSFSKPSAGQNQLPAISEVGYVGYA
ncbi:unnamed protein product [Protopolystoma xenopodis]|uniref:Uncharacterized protein n=1 Tax=Protopolystoma xenopodis TaxID=117903 RepID=A0A448WVH6_9PLAT|nr:unnamed protein product [Protopolystoma xenopodis]